jgi:hypothetical protein
VSSGAAGRSTTGLEVISNRHWPLPPAAPGGGRTAHDLLRKLQELERHLRAAEARVTSSEFRLRRQFKVPGGLRIKARMHGQRGQGEQAKQRPD